MDKPILIGIAGGSGSGKTTVQRRIVESLDQSQILVIEHDSYYRDLSHLPIEARTKFNFDHPDLLETELLVHDLDELLKGNSIDMPLYDFAEYIRKAESRKWSPRLS